MSEVKYEIQINGGNVKATVTTRYTFADKDILDRVGYPTVDFGGTIPDGGAGSGGFSLTSNEKKVTDGLPVSVEFKDTADAPALKKNKALDWIEEITSRLNTGLTDQQALNTAISAADEEGINAIG